MSQKLFIDKLTVLLRHYREAAGLSQSEISDRLKIGLRSYQRYEAGESVPSIDLLYLLSRELKFELNELFSSEAQKSALDGFKLYLGEDKKQFENSSDVLNSRLMDIYRSNEFRKVLETGDIKIIKENEIFKNSQFALSLSHPKHTVFNPCAQKLTGNHTDIFPSIGLHGDPKQMGMAWALVMENEDCFFENRLSPEFPKGVAQMGVKGIYTGQNSHYLVLALLDINIIGKKR